MFLPDGRSSYCYNVYCQDMKINDTPYSTLPVDSLQACINLCDDTTSTCNTFDYDSINGECSLYVSTTLDLTSSPGSAAGGTMVGHLGRLQQHVTILLVMERNLANVAHCAIHARRAVTRKANAEQLYTKSAPTNEVQGDILHYLYRLCRTRAHPASKERSIVVHTYLVVLSEA